MLITEQIKEVVTDYFRDKPVHKVYLFGSYARGEADESSDVDSLIELDESEKICLQFFGWPDELEEILQKKEDVISSGALRKDRIIIKFIEEQKVMIYAKAN